MSSSDEMQVKPADGLKVPDLERAGFLAPDVATTVPVNSYWLRRVKDGDVVVVDAPPAAPADDAGGQTSDNAGANGDDAGPGKAKRTSTTSKT